MITVMYQYYSTTQFWGIERVEFANGEVWNGERIRAETWMRGTDNADTFSVPNDVKHAAGGKGNDTISSSGSGSLTYHYKLGDGNDTITNPSSGYHRDDTLRFEDLNPAWMWC